MGLILRAAVRTHAGRIRENNEDNFYLQTRCRTDVTQPEAAYACAAADSRFLAAVADGMGGEAAGEKASLLAVQALHPCAIERTEEYAHAAVMQANEGICTEMRKNGGSRMGSTLAALYIDAGQFLCCNIGDSRCYRLRGGVLTQLSTDHNKAKRMVELGVLTKEQAARHPSRHELTQHLGIFPEEILIEPALCGPQTVEAGDVFLLCSDGLTDMVDEDQIAAVLAGPGPAQTQADALVEQALAAGGRDNVTVLVVRAEPDKRAVLEQKLARLNEFFCRSLGKGKPGTSISDKVCGMMRRTV